MSTREDYPAGVPCWVDTSQPDPVDAARFYSGLFGWQTEDAMPPDAGSSLLHGPHRRPRRGRDLLAVPGAPPQAVWNTYIRVESADDAAARVREAGGRVLSEPFDVFDAGRMGAFADPEGAVFCVWQPGSHRGSAAVNEHGAVNFNNLHTDDVEAHGLSTAPCSAGRRSTPARRCGPCRATATIWRSSTPACARG